jgi:phage terminase small subunit
MTVSLTSNGLGTEVIPMPRRSSASLSVVPSIAFSARLAPPADLSPEERAIFISLVGSKRVEAFEPSDMPLLCAYCTAIVLEQRAAAALRAEGPVIAGSPSPWLQAHAQAVKYMLALSLRLRLSPQGRRSPDRPGRVPVLSFYERAALEQQQDDVDADDPD